MCTCEVIWKIYTVKDEAAMYYVEKGLIEFSVLLKYSVAFSFHVIVLRCMGG